MSVPTETAFLATTDDDGAAEPTSTILECRERHEECERIGAMLQQMCVLNDQVEQISRKYFPGGVTFTLEADPEVAGAYFMVHAPVRGTVEEVAALQQKWTAELWDKLREASRFYGLSVIFQ